MTQEETVYCFKCGDKTDQIAIVCDNCDDSYATSLALQQESERNNSVKQAVAQEVRNNYETNQKIKLIRFFNYLGLGTYAEGKKAVDTYYAHLRSKNEEHYI